MGHVDTCTINPKCVSVRELYGESNPDTFEWSDGLIAMTTRRFASDAPAVTSTKESLPAVALRRNSVAPPHVSVKVLRMASVSLSMIPSPLNEHHKDKILVEAN